METTNTYEDQLLHKAKISKEYDTVTCFRPLKGNLIGYKYEALLKFKTKDLIDYFKNRLEEGYRLDPKYVQDKYHVMNWDFKESVPHLINSKEDLDRILCVYNPILALVKPNQNSNWKPPKGFSREEILDLDRLIIPKKFYGTEEKDINNKLEMIRNAEKYFNDLEKAKNMLMTMRGELDLTKNMLAKSSAMWDNYRWIGFIVLITIGERIGSWVITTGLEKILGLVF